MECVLLHSQREPTQALPLLNGQTRVQAMRVDVSTKRAAAFAKRLLQVAIPGPPHFACGSLLLISEVLKVGSCICNV
jgi:hypothetical protein